MHLDHDSSLAAWFGKLTGYKGDLSVPRKGYVISSAMRLQTLSIIAR
jgi:hypothetical protein